MSEKPGLGIPLEQILKYSGLEHRLSGAGEDFLYKIIQDLFFEIQKLKNKNESLQGRIEYLEGKTR